MIDVQLWLKVPLVSKTDGGALAGQSTEDSEDKHISHLR